MRSVPSQDNVENILDRFKALADDRDSFTYWVENKHVTQKQSN